MLSGIVIGIVCVPALLTLLWFGEVLAGCVALLKKRQTTQVLPSDEPSHRTALLIPAHNEGTGLLPTLHNARAQLAPNDRMVVIADNCTDDTAKVARAAGVEVIVRNDPQRRGKGYALQFGVWHLNKDPPDIVVFMDADCLLEDGALCRLSQSAMASGRPAQGLYLMTAPEGGSYEQGVKVFAWRVKNWLRPLGLQLLGLPTQLFGTGMAFPFRILEGRDLGNSRLAEDTALGLALTTSGHPPLFVSDALVQSQFPISKAGGDQQRERWEKGHLDNIAALVPRAIVRSLFTRNLPLAVLATDLAVPPLALLVVVIAFCQILGGVAFIAGASSATLAIPMMSALLLAAGTVLAWAMIGRDVLPLRSLLRLPLHVVGKLNLYRRIASGKTTSVWVRTDRKGP